jgi:hypothetical protein
MTVHGGVSGGITLPVLQEWVRGESHRTKRCKPKSTNEPKSRQEACAGTTKHTSMRRRTSAALRQDITGVNVGVSPLRRSTKIQECTEDDQVAGTISYKQLQTRTRGWQIAAISITESIAAVVRKPTCHNRSVNAGVQKV